MSFTVADGRILITDTDGSVVLDTNERPALLTDYIEGRQDYAYRDTPISEWSDRVIGTCTAGSTFIFAMAKINSAGSLWLGTTPGLWFNVSGTLSHIGPYLYDSSFFTHSVIITGEQVILRETVKIRRRLVSGGPQWYPVAAYTFRYKIWVGRFHG